MSPGMLHQDGGPPNTLRRKQNGRWQDIHKCFQAPILYRVYEIIIKIPGLSSFTWRTQVIKLYVTRTDKAGAEQETNHYLNQCWPRSIPPYGIIRPWYSTLKVSVYAQSLTKPPQKLLIMLSSHQNFIQKYWHFRQNNSMWGTPMSILMSDD